MMMLLQKILRISGLARSATLSRDPVVVQQTAAQGRSVLALLAGLLISPALLGGTPARAEDPIRLRIVGGLAGVSQYVRYEQ
ncbi:MAG: hypothetical protein ACKO9A_04585, partial [Alphaproteobacteria bacterium]